MADAAIILAMCMTCTVVHATDVMCRDVIDSLSTWVEQIGNLSYTNIHTGSDTRKFRHNLNARCPANSGIGHSSSGLHQTSLCPWVYVTDLDYDRFPHQMVYARCSCGRCAATNGVYHVCRPIYQSLHVIRRVCRNGIYIYISTYVNLPVACVCSYRETLLVNKRQKT